MGIFYSRTKNKPIKDQTLVSNKLDTCTYKNTKPFVPPITGGKVIKVYDGDTIHIAAYVWSNTIYRFSVRLLGFDSAEIRTRDLDEKHAAILARDALSLLIMNKYITLKKVSLEKYGRILADIYLDDLHINRWMIKNNYGIPYDGGSKTKVNWKLHTDTYFSN